MGRVERADGCQRDPLMGRRRGPASTTNEVSAELGTGLRWLITGAGLTVGVALFTLAYQVLTATELRDVIVGGAITAAFWQLLQVNVVRSRRLWPRALLAPFTDDVNLTEADRRVYSAHASAAAFKGFETITTDFADPQRSWAGR